MKINVKKPTDKDLEAKGVLSWPIGKKKFRDLIGTMTALKNVSCSRARLLWKQKMEIKWNSKKGILLHFQKDCHVSGILKHR
jgi:hypothetical protein